MSDHEANTISLRDIIDAQLETQDEINIGRIDDIKAYWREDGALVVTNLVTGPQSLAGRIAPPLRSWIRSLLHNRFEHCIALGEVEHIGLIVRLRHRAQDYPIGKSDRWIAEHILRWIPGSGY